MRFDLTRAIMNKKTEINKGDFNLYKKNISYNEIFGDIEDVKIQKNKNNKVILILIVAIVLTLNMIIKIKIYLIKILIIQK